MASGDAVPPTRNAREPEADLIAGRKWLDGMEKQGLAALPPLSPALEEFYSDISVSDGWQSKCKIIKPKESLPSDGNNEDGRKVRHPLIVYFYGGGYGMGCNDQVTRPAREWAEEHHATVVCPSYRSTPEYIWPRNVKDGWDVVSYLARHSETDQRFGKVNLDDGFIVGGVSAGGNAAGVIGGIAVLTESDPESHKLTPMVDKLAKPLTGLFLDVPLLTHKEMIPPAYKHLFRSWEDNRNDPSMNLDALMTTFRILQCPDYKSPWFSPINVLERAIPSTGAGIGTGTGTGTGSGVSDGLSSSTPKLDISRHPPVYLQACARDPIRDDVTIYHQMLKDAGLESRTKMRLFPDDGHTAWTVLGLETKSKNPTIKEAVLEGMNWLLNGKVEK